VPPGVEVCHGRGENSLAFVQLAAVLIIHRKLTMHVRFPGRLFVRYRLQVMVITAS
jgi:hypothetical protein